MERKQSKKVKALRASPVLENRVSKNSQKQAFESELNLMLSNRFRTFKGMAPAYSPMKIDRCIRRFGFTTNFSGTFVISDGHGQFLVGTSATTASTYIDMWRIRRLRVYCRNNEADYSCQVQITPSGNDGSNNYINGVVKTFAVESQSSALAQILEIKPGLNQPMGLWHKTNNINPSGPLFSIACSSGGGSIDNNSLLEIEFEYILNVFGAIQAYALTGLSGLTTGLLYGAALGGGLLPALDVNHI